MMTPNSHWAHLKCFFLLFFCFFWHQESNMIMDGKIPTQKLRLEQYYIPDSDSAMQCSRSIHSDYHEALQFACAGVPHYHHHNHHQGSSTPFQLHDTIYKQKNQKPMKPELSFFVCFLFLFCFVFILKHITNTTFKHQS